MPIWVRSRVDDPVEEDEGCHAGGQHEQRREHDRHRSEAVDVQQQRRVGRVISTRGHRTRSGGERRVTHSLIDRLDVHVVLVGDEDVGLGHFGWDGGEERVGHEHHAEGARRREDVLAVSSGPDVLGRVRDADDVGLAPCPGHQDLDRVDRADLERVGHVGLDHDRRLVLGMQILALGHGDPVDPGLLVRWHGHDATQEHVPVDPHRDVGPNPALDDVDSFETCGIGLEPRVGAHHRDIGEVQPVIGRVVRRIQVPVRVEGCGEQQDTQTDRHRHREELAPLAPDVALALDVEQAHQSRSPG